MKKNSEKASKWTEDLINKRVKFFKAYKIVWNKNFKKAVRNDSAHR